jgi:ABC-type antimicrobial peptide transport system permease subunit
MIDGRDLRPEEVFPGTAIVNEAFARAFFGGRDPVGQSFDTMINGKNVRSRIAGYVRDARYRNLRESIQPTVYVPLEASPSGTHWATLAVRTRSADPLAMASLLRQEVVRASPEFRVVNIRTQMELIEHHTVRERLLAMLSIFFASVALVLAGIGLYGVLSYTAVQRRREVGIRMALGAPLRAVAGRMAGEVAVMLALGSIAGVLAGLGSQKYLEALLYQVKATDPGILLAPALTVLAVALVASLPPVLYAMRIDPAETLRAE